MKDLITSMLSKPSRSEETLLFAKNFLQHPRMLGSLIPSSRFLIDRLLSRVDWNRAKTIVEYGPGVGTITAHILSRMSPDARLVVFEMNEDFVNYLARTFPDPRLHVVHGSAENVQRELDRLKLDGADYIISGIPYTTMPVDLREKIMRESREALNPGGAALVYQFTRAVLPYLQSHFRQSTRILSPVTSCRLGCFTALRRLAAGFPISPSSLPIDHPRVSSVLLPCGGRFCFSDYGDRARCRRFLPVRDVPVCTPHPTPHFFTFCCKQRHLHKSTLAPRLGGPWGPLRDPWVTQG